jgi:hypothetical protein
MKFWKQAFITTICFFSITATVLYTSCTKDSCADQVCYNGGYCNAGFCVCPSGYSGPTCTARPVQPYIGTYYGYEEVGPLPSVRDTVDVLTSTDSLSVYVIDHANRYDTLHGSLSSTASSNIISIPVDSTASRKIVYSATVIGKQLNFYYITDDYTTGLRPTTTFQGSRP